jgi:hypothetical protein
MNGSWRLRFLPSARRQREKKAKGDGPGGPPQTPTASGLIIPVGLAISCVAHLAFLTPAVILGGVHLFDPAPEDAITVDIVSPDDVEEARKAEASPADVAPTPDAKRASAPAADPPPQPQPSARAIGQDGTREAAVQPQSALPAWPPAAWLPQDFAPAYPEPAQPRDDIAAGMFAMPLALPGGSAGKEEQGPAIEKADIPDDAIAAFRKHLKTCSVLPAVATARARVTLKIHLNPDGTLMKGPEQNPRPVGNIFGYPDGGGGELFNAAMAAVRKCQPYNMLPPDKYEEWKTFEITFTRENF